jgi:hypothetical protein
MAQVVENGGLSIQLGATGLGGGEFFYLDSP